MYLDVNTNLESTKGNPITLSVPTRRIPSLLLRITASYPFYKANHFPLTLSGIRASALWKVGEGRLVEVFFPSFNKFVSKLTYWF